MKLPFKDCTILITGASSGLGRAMAIELGGAGAELVLVGRSAEQLDATAAAIKKAGGPPALCAPMDLRERGPLADLIGRLGGEQRRLFAVINNAGIMHPEPVMSGTVDRWQAMFDVNVLAPLEACQAAIKVMRAARKPGYLINVSSFLSRSETGGVYGASKAALAMISRSIRAELQQDDIRICNITPGIFATQSIRGFAPAELARAGAALEKQGLTGREEKHFGDPAHVARMVRYVLEQPIDLNIFEVEIRPPIDFKYT